MNILNRMVAFGVVLCVGSTIAKEMNKQLPRELQINLNKIFLQALLFALTCGIVSYIVLSLVM